MERLNEKYEQRKQDIESEKYSEINELEKQILSKEDLTKQKKEDGAAAKHTIEQLNTNIENIKVKVIYSIVHIKLA